MAGSQPYIVLRLVPESPVDGATFATYLDSLAIQVFDANTNLPRSGLAYSSPLILTDWPGVDGRICVVSLETSQPTTYDKNTKKYGNTLTFDSTAGIPFGSYVLSADQKTIDPGKGLKVSKNLTETQAFLSGDLDNYVPAGTVVTFLGSLTGGDPATAPPVSFVLPTSADATNVEGAPLVLNFADASGVSVGMDVSGPSIAPGTTVAEVDPAVTPAWVMLSQPLTGPGFPLSVTFTLEPPFAYITQTAKSGTPTAHPTTLKFNAGQTDGIAVGMTLTPVAAGAGVAGIDAGTMVTGVTPTTVTLSKELRAKLPSGGQDIQFNFPLSKGIFQHVEPLFKWDFLSLHVALIPSAVATAVIQLNPPQGPPDDYLDIKIRATRGADVIPKRETFYNVRLSTDTPPQAPWQYQNIAASDTSLYLSLPPPPGLNPISLALPADGSAPPFDLLYAAIQNALSNDQITSPPATVPALISSPANCLRIAYDIVWSYQNTLPLPPDPLDSLYTNPPNPGGGGGNASGTSGGSNNYEQDRQKFEGMLSSFYSTRNATAERLAKFVAAASAAVACEQASLNSTTALLSFPVDPPAAFAAAVESELLVAGLGTAGPSGLTFGVPAAFFYALGAHLDKGTTAAHRFQMATGEAIERLLQQFATAADADVIDKSEAFTDSSLGPTKITAFQAARRLVALGVSAASSSAPATVFAGSPLATLISGWLSADEPPPENPPLTYPNTDFNIWTQRLAGSHLAGYLDLDLDALTQGYVIPPFAASPTISAAAGSAALTFAVGMGIGPGMPVTGPNIAAGTTVHDVTISTQTQVTLSTSVAGDVPAGTVITFAGPPGPTVTAATSADCPSGAMLLFAGAAGVSGISAGMAVSGQNIPAGATVQSTATVTTAAVTLSAAVSGPVPTSALLVFNHALPPVTAVTTADCPSGTTLAFGGAGGTTGISAGMAVFGRNIAAGTTVRSVAASTVVLSMPVSGDVPSGSEITFAAVPKSPVTAATTTADCPLGTTKLTFGGAAGTTGISAGMAVFGPNIAAGSTAQSVAGSTVTLSAAVSADVASGSVITFTATSSTLAGQIAAWLPSTTTPLTPQPTVGTLKEVTAAQWTAFLTDLGGPGWLPPFTQPIAPGASPAPATPKAGYIAVRIRAFIRAVHQFFTVSSAATAAQLPAAGTPPAFDQPAFDPISQAVGDLPGSFQFGDPLPGTDLATAVQTVFGSDPEAQAWLFETMTTLNELWEIAGAAPPPPTLPGYPAPDPARYRFSVMEALYARGFPSAKEITALSAADFQQAMTGTIAYDAATSGSPSLYEKALDLAPHTPPPHETGGPFQPVNPDGSLVNCVPPPCLSPTGPIAYLQEMLTLSPLSTCDVLTTGPLSLATDAEAPASGTELTFTSAASVFAGMSASADGIPGETTVTAVTVNSVTLSQQLTAAVPAGTTVEFTAATLGAVLSQRRGPAGDLAASCANLETPLPLIDIVNECLEYLGAAKQPTAGTVYDTASRDLAGHALCTGDSPTGDAAHCHDPASLFAALPQYSTPATPVAANAAVEPAVFNKLKRDFSSCLLPYSPALDVSRSYLRHLGSSRFGQMRAFRKCITEFVLDPANEPSGFSSWLWRYPVRIDIAIEYLGITREEYALLFRGTPAAPCTPPEDDAAGAAAAAAPAGRPPAPVPAALSGTVTVPMFLAETCLSYCEFYELWQSGFVEFRNGADERDGAFPRCEPCCLDDLWLQFPAEQQEQNVAELLVFTRLWRKLRESTTTCYSFAQLRDICDVLALYQDGALNPDFIRQLAAFQMLRDHFGLELADRAAKPPPTAVDADRTHLLALWTGAAAPHWPWAVRQLIAHVQQHAQQRHHCERRPPEFMKLLAENLDPLSRLAGFDPGSATDSWHAHPAHTLRFAEVLAKIYASRFSVGELIFLFTAGPHLDGDDPFPLQEPNEALDSPLGLPDDEPAHPLWHLRRDLLEARAADDDADDWPWRRIESALHADFGFAPSDVQALSQHFFPGALARSGFPVSAAQSRFVSGLPAASTSALKWNTPPDGPFEYDPATGQLSARVPLTDRAVITKLTQTQDLNGAEQQAVQDLFFQPRALLARFALLFSDFAAAQRRLIEESDEPRRFAYFRDQFLLCRRRCRIIHQHLARYVAAATGQPEPEDDAAASLILRALAADENTAPGGWEDDSGATPALTWAPPPNGSALAALLGLAGTGLIAEYRSADGTLLWRDESGRLSGFGAERDKENCPVPTVLPSLAAALTPAQLQFASVRNGFLMNDATGAWLGGAQGFGVTWSGALLVDVDGTYEFWAGAPAPGDERPNFEAAEHRRWRVVLGRGQRRWVILSHHWPGEEEHRASSLPLRRGVYELTAELVQPAPEFHDEEQLRRQHTGFQVKYSGPDSGGRPAEIPHSRLFVLKKEQTLADGTDGLSPGAAAYLSGLYVSSLRDIRRTYQRAFKALLFTHRFGLSAHRQPHGTSELGYMLANPERFAGAGYYRSGGGFTRHAAGFDVNFLPLLDDYRAPAQDARTAPSPQRSQAMFDWWERMFDYTAARAEVHRRRRRQLWHLFEEAHDKQPANPRSLLRHMDADERHWDQDLRYFQGQQAPVYEVTSADLEDDRWVLRAWHADRWLRALQRSFAARDITVARPDLWASDDPSAQLPGEQETGNANLVAFVIDGCLENGEARRYGDLRRLNDGLRDRGRRALVAYLCHGDRVPLPGQPGRFATAPGDLGELLLLDVEAGVCEQASRIEEVTTAAQLLVRRGRLGLEPGWKVTREFARLWDSRFESYRTWERCRRRELYRENWIEWEELDKARHIEAFRFLEDQLRASTLTLAAPGGLDWWLDDAADLEEAPPLLQRRVPSELRSLPAPPGSVTLTREGFATLGSPEFAAQPTWLAAVPEASAPDDNASSPSAPGPPAADGGAAAGPAVAPAPAEPAAVPPAGAPAPAPAGPEAAGVPADAPAPSPAGPAPGAPAPATPESLAQAAAAGAAQPQPLPLWLESAMKLGTRFVRVAAAGPPQAALGFGPHGDEARGGCCHECGREHPVVADEYYFWLVNTQFYSYNDETDAQSNGDASFQGSYQFGFQDSYYDRFQQQSAEWNDEGQVPPLLAKWEPNPAVRLAWCRIHNGEFGQPRRSEEYIQVAEPPDLVFLGRAADSLYFQVSGSAPLPAGHGPDPSPPGFRYDLPSDHAVSLPRVLAPPLATHSYPGGLPAYPFFAYHEPGARLFPGSWFPVSMAVAGSLRAHCRFELALRWYQRSFDPLDRDCAWVHCDDSGKAPTHDEIAQRAREIWEQHGRLRGKQDQNWLEAEAALRQAGEEEGGPRTSRRGGCCDSTKVTAQGARNRAVTLHYCRTALDWGDALMRRRRSPEAFQQARLIYDTVAKITGSRPETVLLEEPATVPSVTAFIPAYAPLNPELMDLYDRVADRRALIHRCLNARRLPLGQLNKDVPYFGDSVLTGGWRAVPETCADEEDWCTRPSPYRFLSQIQKATEIAGRVRELGSALLSAYEKGDAEYLASIRADQEREMLTLGVSVRQYQWRDADWQVQALQQTKELNQASLLYYANMFQGGLINDEIQNLGLSTNALQTRTGANFIEVVGEIMSIVPDFFVGAMSTFSQIPIGTKLGGLFQAIAKVMQTVADIQASTAAIDLTQAGWQRRANEWFQQMQTLPIQIQQIELQVLGAHRRRDQALQELNNQQRQIEHSAEVLDFLRDKFTATGLYLWLQKETFALHSTMYELALRAAREAERAFNFERGYTTRRFIPEETWDSLHAGLLAGERLEVALRHMEKAYLDENRREYELTKHISLRLDFPAAYLRLRTSGYCEISIPEWMFDLDYPGQYLRRIKNIMMTLPCVTGPYTGVHCRLTLLSSMTRIRPEVRPPAHNCCGNADERSEYEACPDDPRVVREYAACESIATSSGQNDSGMFELNFRDDRYLPFEYRGAVCRLRLELPPEHNYFDLDTLSDVVLHLNHTAREGGEALRAAAVRDARGRLPGDGLRVFDVRHDFADAWSALRRADRDSSRDDREDHHRRLRLGFTPAMFPFVPGRRVRHIDRLLLLFGAPDATPGRHHLVRFWRDEAEHDAANRDEVTEFPCVADGAWPGLFCGTIDLRDHPLGPLRDERSAACTFEFPAHSGEISRVFVIAHYEAERWPPDGRPTRAEAPGEPGRGRHHRDDAPADGHRSSTPAEG